MDRAVRIALSCAIMVGFGLAAGCAPIPLLDRTPPAPTTQATLRHWLQAVDRAIGPCARAYGQMAAQARAALQPAVGVLALGPQINAEYQRCQDAAIPPLPAPLTKDRTARAAYAAASQSLEYAQDATTRLQDIAEGDTNAAEIRHALGTLQQAARAYQTYVRLARGAGVHDG